jgi:DNA polymerase delta subunit 3
MVSRIGGYTVAEGILNNADETMTDSQEVASAEKVAVDVSTSQGVEPTEAEEPSSMVHGGRRRGRRQVKKKKTVKDDEGYLVTREELAWESFSEEEPAPSKPKSSGLSSSQASKGGKSSGKPGQGKGNIMSFFSKK